MNKKLSLFLAVIMFGLFWESLETDAIGSEKYFHNLITDSKGKQIDLRLYNNYGDMRKREGGHLLSHAVAAEFIDCLGNSTITFRRMEPVMEHYYVSIEIDGNKEYRMDLRSSERVAYAGSYSSFKDYQTNQSYRGGYGVIHSRCLRNWLSDVNLY